MKLSNYNYCQKVIELKKNIEIAFLTLGEYLYNIREKHLYESQWGSFSEYLDEIKMADSVASRLIKVYTKLILEYQIEPEKIAQAGGWSNAYEIVQLSPTKEKAEDWLDEVAIKMPKDIKIALREAKSGIKEEECEHDLYTIRCCRKCSYKERIYEENS